MSRPLSTSTAEIQKKKDERRILNHFVSAPKLKLQVLSIKDSETPDFIVKTTDKTISIELTRLIAPELKEKEAFQDAIIKKAEKLFVEKYGANILVHITFSANAINCKESETGKYVKEIFEIVERVFVPLKTFEFDVMSKDDEPLTHFIDSIRINNHDNFSNWQTFGAFIVPKVDFNRLTKVISNKEKRIKHYAGGFDENWLVMVANFGTQSSAQHFDFVNFHEIQSTFERVFIYQYHRDNIIVIK